MVADKLGALGRVESHAADDDERDRHAEEQQRAGAHVTHHCLRDDTVHRHDEPGSTCSVPSTYQTSPRVLHSLNTRYFSIPRALLK